MAISINTVYQKVLAIANKEQRGYITPQEFNLFSDQAQKEIFEQYFYDINQFNRVPGNQTEFSDQLYMLEEKIAPFRVNGASMTSSTELLDDSEFSDGTFTAWTKVATGSTGFTAEVISNSSNSYTPSIRIVNDNVGTTNPAVFQTVTGLDVSKSYRLSMTVSYAKNPGSNLATRFLLNVTGSDHATEDFFETQNIAETGKTYYVDFQPRFNTQVKVKFGLQEATENDDVELHVSKISLVEIDNATIASDVYRLGEVMYTNTGSTYPTPVAEVNANEMTTYNLSPLARPTTKNPVYVRSSAGSISIYPSALSGAVTYNYVKLPATPKWTYNVVLGKAVYNGSATDVKDFELHDSEENTLVYKILELAGVSMNRADIAQAANNKNMQEVQQQKS